MYKVIITRLVRPDVTNGVKAFAKVLGIPESKAMELAKTFPLVLFEAENHAIARRIKAQFAILDKLGFPLIISMDAGPIPKINWPANVKLNGVSLTEIIKGVEKHTDLMNHCPSCGVEIRYRLELRVEGEQYQMPVSSNEVVSAETFTETLAPDEGLEEIVTLEEDEDEVSALEELTDLDETDSDLSSENQFVAEALEGDVSDLEDFGDLFEAEVAPVVTDVLTADELPVLETTNSDDVEVGGDYLDDSYTDLNHDILEETNYGIGFEFEGVADDNEGADYAIVVGEIKTKREKVQMVRVASSIFGFSDDEAKKIINKKGDVIIQGLNIDDAREYKRLFDEKSLNVRIIN